MIRIWGIDSHPEIEITQEEFNKIKDAKNCLSEALAIEEKYELLLSNYLDLEKESLNIASDAMVRDRSSYKDFFDIRLLFNRRIVNLLTSTKLYIDQIQQHVKMCMPLDTEIEHTITSLFSKEYDNFFEYRFMEALRNYVQHKGLAVHLTSIGSKRVGNRENWEFEYNTKFFTYKSELESDTAFKKRVTNEMPNEVNLIYTSRAYIESISKVHSEIRNIIADNVKSSRDTIQNIINDYEEINNGKSVGLYAICSIPKEPIDEILEKFPLLLDLDDIRLNLSDTNSRLINLKKRYVSNLYSKV